MTRFIERLEVRGFRVLADLKIESLGVNRLFGIVLSLCMARNGVLLVDEVENGLHYSVQCEIWRTLFRLAKDLNVQIFATSHSWDCVQAFQEAAGESLEEGVLTRLSNHNDRIVPTLFSEQDSGHRDARSDRGQVTDDRQARTDGRGI